MKITANGTSLGTFYLTPTSKGCTSVSGATQCTFTIGVPPGKDTFEVFLYDAAKALLSQGTLTKTIRAGTTVTIPLVLEGVVKSVTTALGNPNPNAGTPATTPVYITAYDASGAAIVGPGNYNVSLTMIDTDKSGITSVSPTAINHPGTPVTLTYTGGSLDSATIGPSASGVVVTPATFVPTPTIFASFTATGIAPSSAMFAITSGSDGNVWVTITGGSHAIVRFTPSGTPTIFDHANTPTLSDDTFYDGIVEDASGNVWFTENSNKKIGEIPAGTTPGGTVHEFSVSPICPSKIIQGNNSDFWFTSTCNNEVGNITTAGTFTPSSLAGGGTVYEWLLLSKLDGMLYLIDQTNKAIGRATITGASAGSYSEVVVPNNPIDNSANGNLYGLAQTSDGQLWFTNYTCSPNTIASMSASAFSASAIHEYTSLTGCADPNMMVVAPDGNTIFLCLGNYPAIERIENNGVGVAPTLTDYAVNTQTPNDVFQQTIDITIGPNGNLWTAQQTTGTLSPPNVLEMAY